MLAVIGTFAAEAVSGFDGVDQWSNATRGAVTLIEYTTGFAS